MTVVRPRQDWLPAGEKAFPGAAGFDRASVTHLTAHYAGIDSLDLDGSDNVYQPGDTASLILAMHRNYWASRGYGLGYNFVCDHHQGDLWTVRGFSVRAASDGSAPANLAVVSCLFLTPGTTDDKNGDLTPVQVDAARFLAALTVEHCGPQVTKWSGHRDYYQTPCPGDAIYRRVRAGELWPPTPTPVEDPVKLWKLLDCPGYIGLAVIFAEVMPGRFIHVGPTDAARYAGGADKVNAWANAQELYPGGWAAFSPNFFPRA